LRHRRFVSAFASCVFPLLAACAITSEGLGVDDPPQAALVQWRGFDAVSGEMVALLRDGRRFTGPYVWVAPGVGADRLAPLLEDWGGARHWAHYEGDVLASLRTDDGSRLRCRFHLDEPQSGMHGGGAGRCQATDGRSWPARFPAREEREVST